MMALTRGATANYPCPVCLVPKTEIINLSTFHMLRTTANMKGAWLEGRNMNGIVARDEFLQQFGLRDVEVSEHLG